MLTVKTNEIPVAGELFEKLDLNARLVSLCALHTQGKTARALALEHQADYLLTFKDNQSTIHRTLETLIDEPPEHFPPQEAPSMLRKIKRPAPATTATPSVRLGQPAKASKSKKAAEEETRDDSKST